MNHCFLLNLNGHCCREEDNMYAVIMSIVYTIIFQRFIYLIMINRVMLDNAIS